YITQDMNTTDNADFARVVTPQIVDIIAMADLYGLAPEIFDDNTRYGVNSNLGTYMDIVFSGLTDATFTHPNWNPGQKVAFTIMDTGGSDLIDFSTDTEKQRVDLRQEKLSDVYGVDGSMVIARGTVIEKYIGGTRGDDITSNDAANLLNGRNGADTLKGLKGADELKAGNGNDEVFGGEGADELRGGNGTDILRGGKGKDLIRGGVSKDTIYGQTGDDTLYGNGGGDIFVYQNNGDRDVIKDFQNNKDILQLDDKLWTGTLTVNQVFDQFASNSNGDAVLNFGSGNRITIENLSIAVLKDDVEII
ncbi:MAG: M10 family metallopeptidase C-terminal domain-containing protein, partial [Pseudomonadota bacterium]